MNKLIIFLIFTLSTYSQQQSWFWQNPYPQGNDLYDVSFIDSLHGWAVGYYITLNYNSTIIKTTDGGKNWSVIYTNMIRCNNIYFINEKRGFIGSDSGRILITNDGGYNWEIYQTNNKSYIYGKAFFLDSLNGWLEGGLQTTDGGNTWFSGQSLYSICFVDSLNGWAFNFYGIVHTTDRGKTWTQQFEYDGPYTLPSLSFGDTLNGWAVGWEFDNQKGYAVGIVIHTSDGGINWTKPNIGLPEGPSGLTSVFFMDSKHGCIGGTVVYYTSNGGNNWSPRDTVGSEKIYFPDKKHGWSVGGGGYIYNTSDGGQDWTEQSRGTRNSLFSIFFADSLNGWAAGDNGTIVHTTDGGNYWNEQIDSLQYYYTFHAIKFSNPNIGIAVGNYGLLLKTTDGGNHWIQQNLHTNYFLYSLFFTDSMMCWAVGDEGVILKTTDGGNSWSYNSYDSSTTLMSIYFKDKFYGWIVGDSGTIIHTTDGGNNWYKQISGTDENLYSIYFLDSSKGWISGRNGTILYTTDGGINWLKLSTNITENLGDIFFTNENIGWSRGINTIYHTTDRGITWSRFPNLFFWSLSSMYFSDSNHGWVTGLYGEILKTTNGGITWVEDTPRNNEISKSILNAYPNPFNDIITLDIVGRNRPETLVIYDLFGRTVLTKNTEILESLKTQHITLNTENLPPGVYYVIVKYSPGARVIVKTE
jgi:photosystem II stability/assembly factor-like uncharacterized protein